MVKRRPFAGDTLNPPRIFFSPIKCARARSLIYASLQLSLYLSVYVGGGEGGGKGGDGGGGGAKRGDK
jgi:hypothetical protein